MADDGRFGGVATEAAAPPSPEEFASYDLNDLGNAMRLCRLAGAAIDRQTGAVDITHARLLTVKGIGWIGFNGQYWDREHGENVARILAHKVAYEVKAVAHMVLDEGRELAAAEGPVLNSRTGEPLKKQPTHPVVRRGLDLLEFAESCGQSGKTKAMLEQAESYLTVDFSVFDTDPLALNTPTGTIKMGLEGGRFRWALCPHDPSDRITRMTRVAYDAEARCPKFIMVLNESLPDAAERDYVGRSFGYGTTGFTREQVFSLAQGRGRDGKSTLLDSAREVLGSYGAVGAVDTFLESLRGATGPDPELVKLAGDVRFVVLSEPPRGAKLAEGRIKAWTSGSPISARDLNAKPITFRPRGKLFFECNSFPVTRGDDDGIWRRVRPMMFRHQVPEDRQIKDLAAIIIAEEGSGVLNWLIARVGDWLIKGLDPPESLKSVVQDYRRASSPMGDWLEARCVHGPAAKGERTRSKHLYADFKDWFELQGFDKPPTMKGFGDFLRDRQIMPAGKDAKGLQYRGPIRLKTPGELLDDAAASEASATAAGLASGALSGVEDDFGAFDAP